jgi:DNA-directed RNA polymerase subunit RPC12/RpoP
MEKVKNICKHCGREFYIIQRTTIVSKLCPNCFYKKIMNTRVKNFSKTGKTKVVKSKSKMLNTKQLMIKADAIFSKYIRLKNSFISKNGTIYCKCITCGSLHNIKKIHCGHYHSRRLMSVRYDEDNCRPQCPRCNTFQQGRHTEFGEALKKDIGEERFEELRLRAIMVTKIDFQSIIDTYTVKFSELCLVNHVKKW